MKPPPRFVVYLLGLLGFAALFVSACVGQAISSSRTRARVESVREALRRGSADFAAVERVARANDLEVDCTDDERPCREVRVVGDVSFSRRQFGFLVTLSSEGRVEAVGGLQSRGRRGRTKGRGDWRDAP
jgi:hypothetical protein